MPAIIVVPDEKKKKSSRTSAEYLGADPIAKALNSKPSNSKMMAKMEIPQEVLRKEESSFGDEKDGIHCEPPVRQEDLFQFGLGWGHLMNGKKFFVYHSSNEFWRGAIDRAV